MGALRCCVGGPSPLVWFEGVGGGLFPGSGPQASQVVNKVFPGLSLSFCDIGGPVGLTSQ